MWPDLTPTVCIFKPHKWVLGAIGTLFLEGQGSLVQVKQKIQLQTHWTSIRAFFNNVSSADYYIISCITAVITNSTFHTSYNDHMIDYYSYTLLYYARSTVHLIGCLCNSTTTWSSYFDVTQVQAYSSPLPCNSITAKLLCRDQHGTLLT